ncbi:MAG: aminoacyl-tRNA hydrolase [Erysipelotrichaceae bacterium]
MKLIVGLGNPGREYEKTRHNAGFDVMDQLAKMLEANITTNKFDAHITSVMVKDEKVILMKPQTYMNLSGEAVLKCASFYKIDIGDIIVVHDDLDLPVGKIRLREKGSAGGQKGMANIIQLLKTQEIRRVRIGIGNDKMIPIVDYVLGKVKKEDLEVYEASIEKAAKALKLSINKPFDVVMNRYNK